MAAAAERAAAHGVRSMVGLHLPPGAGDRAGPPAGRRGPARHDPARARAVPAGLDRRPGGAACPGGCRRSKAGSGALGDIGAHIVDLTQFITGERLDRRQRPARDLRRRERPLPRRAPARRCRRHRRGRSGARSPSTTPRSSSAGSPAARSASFEATRFATGRKNAIRIEINGSRRQPRLRLRGHERPALLRRQRAGRARPASGGSSSPSPSTPTSRPGGPPGHGLGYEHGFTHQVVDLVDGDRRGRATRTPSFADGLQVQRVLDAVERSSDAGGLADHCRPSRPPDCSARRAPHDRRTLR